ncbi:hypothetical protein KVR01_005464 [Diaporthe batatas]|uniref:uncharacterized protein n=1 Tax=Diaporthe batatas TaxID=748121 RepID=UPI001D039A38|nr:uncharacterized protein KVR01_005464 [Diaporthe batatas]KAG8165189.1 hypothetical protein KVR01_005464 [Diaporthe batatas]
MAAGFHKFTQLPPEVRNSIWELTLPGPRVHDIYPASTSQKTPASEGLRFANESTERPPAASAVCRESRSIILYHYRPLTLSSATKYVDLSRDILLLESCLLERELYRVLLFMSRISQIRNGIRSIAFGTSYSASLGGIWHPSLGRDAPKPQTKNSMTKFLQRLSVFPRLERVIFVLYQEAQYEVKELPRADAAWDGHLSQNATFYLAGIKPPRVRDIFGKAEKATHDSTNNEEKIGTDGPEPTSCTMPWTQEKPAWPHVNELRYYPPGLGEDLHAEESDDRITKWYRGSWSCTVDDLRRFRMDWTRAADTALKESHGDERSPPGWCKKRGRIPDEEDLQRPQKKQSRQVSVERLRLPTMETASLLWRYTLPAKTS